MARRTVSSALTAALKSTDIRPADQATVELARRYATQLDASGCPECGGPVELAKVGPLLLATLTSLGMTPAGRAAILGKGEQRGEHRPNPLDELRARRAARQRGA